MRIRPPELAAPPYEPAAGYFAPPPHLVVGNEWRAAPPLAVAARTMNATAILTDAVVAQVQQHLTPSATNLGLSLADIAVTGRVAFADFAWTMPQNNGPIGPAAVAKLTALGVSGVTPEIVAIAVSEVLDRAYRVAWFLRAQTARGNLGWIAVSGEDDLPHRPVNVPSSAYPQGELTFTVPGDAAGVAVSTRYIIASGAPPQPGPAALHQRTLPPVGWPVLASDAKVILFIHGSDSRLEEANDIIPKLLFLPDGSPSGYSVISMDLPGSGYVNQIDHTEVGSWTATTVPSHWPFPAFGLGAVTISLLPFLEKFLVNFVATLSPRLGPPGYLEDRIVGVMGGSLGGNLALRLARRPEPWIRRAIAFSAGSVWNANGLAHVDPFGPIDFLALQAGAELAKPLVAAVETNTSRDEFFAGTFDQRIPSKTQPEQWYRDNFPSKMQYIENARLDRRETYTSQYRRWHWRVSLEELLWSWQVPAVQNFRVPILLGAGAADDNIPVQIYTNTRRVAAQLSGAKGDTFFWKNTGHSVHAERPAALAQRIRDFLAAGPGSSWLTLGAPTGAKARTFLSAITVMDSPASPQRTHVFVEGDDFNLWCLWSSGTSWNWTNMKKPGAVNLTGFAGIVTVKDPANSRQQPHLFVGGNDGNLWCRWSNGSVWDWLNLQRPPATPIQLLMGAVTVMDTPTAEQRPHVFLLGKNDGNLWCRYRTGATWNWANMKQPTTNGVSIKAFGGVVTVMDNPTAPQRAHVFVLGSDGHIWCCFSDTAAWNWVDMGKPAGLPKIRALLGAMTVMDTTSSAQRAHVFVEADDFNLWCLWSDTRTWNWTNLNKPDSVDIKGGIGAVSVMDSPSSAQRPHLFVTGSDGNLWLCCVDAPGHWDWQNQGRPFAASLSAPGAAVTVMDTPTAAQRAHAFVNGPNGTIWVDWWG